MILVDTSVWVDHLRHRNALLAERLEAGDVLTHPLVIGELACGNLRDRSEILGLLNALPLAIQAGHQELVQFVEERDLHGKGLGWIDVSLLGAALLTPCELWTLDKPLSAAAKRLGVAVGPKRV